jgi:hypothetical protein
MRLDAFSNPPTPSFAEVAKEYEARAEARTTTMTNGLSMSDPPSGFRASASFRIAGQPIGRNKARLIWIKTLGGEPAARN